ncbi:MAG: coenzyme F420-0:L-glutamate ligase [Luminiphilus sp.]|nr:coenzyme F420-0:L-glutamate ligase [Luminiphilus sp.]
MSAEISLTALDGLPLITADDDLVALVVSASTANGFIPRPGDVLVLAQKIVSKVEGRQVCLNDVQPDPDAMLLAEKTGKDPRLVALILSESVAVIRSRPGLIIVEHKTGHILANAGIDASNINQDGPGATVLLWPGDPDASARALSGALSDHYGFRVPVVINDSIGRAWRMGTVGHAIGVAGLDPLWNQVGERDLYGNELRVTEPATADGIAAAAALLQGEAAEGRPAIWVRGCPLAGSPGRGAKALLRPHAADMFR